MSKKNKPDKRGYVYSTDPDFRFEETKPAVQATLPPAQQRLKIKLDTKQRAGRAVTLVEGFIGSNEDLEALGKQLKTVCGTGGSVKDQVVIVQGDHREKIIQWLKTAGYKMI